jgi:hypothetical protein
MTSPPTNIDKLVDWLTTLDLNMLFSSLIGLGGVIIGILINEYFKRKNRESLYSDAIFQKRLSVYEELFTKMHKASEIGGEIIKEKNLSKKERHKIWSSIVLDIASYTDKNKLYLNEKIAVHCMLTLIGIEDIHDLPEDEQKVETSKFYTGLKEAGDLIKEETGLKRLDKFFKKINKPNISSSYIEAFSKIKEEYEEKEN